MLDVSVIIPVHNRERLVGEAIKSVLSQTLAPREVIVVDDGSSDRTAAVVEGFGPPVRLVRQPHRGPGAARNRGAGEALGEWVAFLDSDDLWLKHKLAAVAGLIESEPTVDLAHSDGFLVRGETVPDLDHADTFFKGAEPARGPSALELLMSAPIITPSVVVRSGTLRGLGGFDERLRYSEDVDFYIRFLAAGHSMGYVDRPLVVMRDLTLGRGQPRLPCMMDVARALEKNYRRFPAARSVLRPSLLESLLYAFEYALKDDRPRLAASLLSRTFRYRRPSLTYAWHVLLLAVGGRRGRELVKTRWKKFLDRLQ